MLTHYQTLGVYPSATAEEIAAAYRQLALALHPDREGGDRSKFAYVTFAHAILKDAQKRHEYDAFLAFTRKRCGACDGKGYAPVIKRFREVGRKPCLICEGVGYVA